MGVFDYVRCEYPLPGLADPTSVLFQTKDTDAMYLDKYIISKEGRLIHHKPVKWEDRSPKGATGLMALCGACTPVEFIDEDTNFHGVLNFYGDKHTGELRLLSLAPENFLQDLNHPEATEWFEYEATFENGFLVKVVRVDTGKGEGK